MSTSKQPFGTRVLRIGAGLAALVVAFGVPATTSAKYRPQPPSGEVLPPASESGGPTPPALESSGATPAGAVEEVQGAALPQTGSELDGTLALGAGALLAGLGMSAMAWRRRTLSA